MLEERARKIADEAKAKGMWLYEPSFKKWYSPEEFKHVFHYANLSDDVFKSLQIRPPSEGIEAGFKRLEDMRLKLQWFTKAVIEYYNK